MKISKFQIDAIKRSIADAALKRLEKEYADASASHLARVSSGDPDAIGAARMTMAAAKLDGYRQAMLQIFGAIEATMGE